jgi:hypothetical protein
MLAASVDANSCARGTTESIEITDYFPPSLGATIYVPAFASSIVRHPHCLNSKVEFVRIEFVPPTIWHATGGGMKG